MRFYIIESDGRLAFANEIEVHNHSFVYRDGAELKMATPTRIYKIDSHGTEEDVENWTSLITAFRTPKNLRIEIEESGYDPFLSDKKAEEVRFRGEPLFCNFYLINLEGEESEFMITDDGTIVENMSDFLMMGRIYNLGEFGTNIANMTTVVTPAGIVITKRKRDENGKAVGLRDSHDSPLSREVLNYLKGNPYSTVHEIKTAINRPRHSVTARISELYDYGFVRPCGTKPTTNSRKGTVWCATTKAEDY